MYFLQSCLSCLWEHSLHASCNSPAFPLVNPNGLTAVRQLDQLLPLSSCIEVVSSWSSVPMQYLHNSTPWFWDPAIFYLSNKGRTWLENSAWVPSYFQHYSFVGLHCTMCDLGVLPALRLRRRLQLHPWLHFGVWIRCKSSFPELDFLCKKSQHVLVSFVHSPVKATKRIGLVGLICFLVQSWPTWVLKEERSGQTKSSWFILQPFSSLTAAWSPLKSWGRVMIFGKVTWKGDHVFCILAISWSSTIP